MPSNFRRLAADHAALHHDLPPYYMLPADNQPDDLSQLTILLAGPEGTPYSRGIWRLNLKMPADYPKSPPKATFRTKIWHPNVEENTGAVCVDTLKRDWESKLTLRDVLVTISCLLIHPNPDSALNSSAGTLLREDFQSFAHQAQLMTSIHAPIPPSMVSAVRDAKRRGEDPDTLNTEDQPATQPPRKQPRLHRGGGAQARMQPDTIITANHHHHHQNNNNNNTNNTDSDNENENDNENEDPTKENNPSLSPTPIRQSQHQYPPPSPRKNPGKRPLSVLSIPPHPSENDIDDADEMMIDETPATSASEENVFANRRTTRSQSPRKTPKRSMQRARARGSRSPTYSQFPGMSSMKMQMQSQMPMPMQIHEDVPDRTLYPRTEPKGTPQSTTASATGAIGIKITNTSPSKRFEISPRKAAKAKPKARIGIRRL